MPPACAAAFAYIPGLPRSRTQHLPTPAPDSRRLAPGRADSHSPLAWPLRALRPLLHRALLRGLRAPRLAHDPPIAQLAQLAQGTRHALRLETLHLRGARGQTLAAWLLTQDLRGPAHASATSATSATREPSAQPLPAVLAMHGWGANASTLWPAVDPLLAAGFAVMLVDACHGGRRRTSPRCHASPKTSPRHWRRSAPIPQSTATGSRCLAIRSARAPRCCTPRARRRIRRPDRVWCARWSACRPSRTPPR
jgi:hypothetical protein